MRINEKLHEVFVVCWRWQGNRQESRGGKFIQNDHIFFSSFRALQGVNLITQITSHIISLPQMRGKLGMVAGGLAQHNSEFSHSKYFHILCLKKLLVNILCFFSYEVMAPPSTLSMFNGFWLNHWELLTLCPRIYGSSLPFPPLPSPLLSSSFSPSLSLCLSISVSFSLGNMYISKTSWRWRVREVNLLLEFSLFSFF